MDNTLVVVAVEGDNTLAAELGSTVQIRTLVVHTAVGPYMSGLCRQEQYSIQPVVNNMLVELIVVLDDNEFKLKFQHT